MTPQKYAIDISNLLNAVYKTSEERFPIDIKSIALEYSKIKFPDEPLVDIIDGDFDNLEGMLTNVNGWHIIYNSSNTTGRINFTIAHEFGHYLLHRHTLKNGIKCDETALRTWGSEANNYESEANIFASYLLMPLDDFRKQIKGKPITLELFQQLSLRYNTSLTATILKYIEQTPERVVFIYSIDGFIDWARSSDSALKTKKYFAARRSNAEPIEVPDSSFAATNTTNLEGRYVNNGPWFPDVGYTEMNLNVKDKNFTLLILDRYDNKRTEKLFIRL